MTLFCSNNGVSVARVKIKGKVSNLDDPYNHAVSWDMALDEKNIDMAAMILQKAVNSNEPSYISLYDLRIDSSYYDNLVFATNALAFKIKTKARRLPDNFNNDKILDLDLKSKENTFYVINWVNLYYHDLYRISRQYFNNPKKDAPPISPEKVFDVLNQVDYAYFPDSSYVERIKLNHSLSSIHYYAWINNYSLVNKYFDLIFAYFYRANLPIEEATDLALYANKFHRYDKCVQMLDFYYDRNLLDERAAFVLAQTATLIQKELNEDDLIGHMNIAIEFNKTRWCNWLNSNFQVLRNEKVKAICCETCK